MGEYRLCDYTRLEHYQHWPFNTNDLYDELNIDPDMFGHSPSFHVRRPRGQTRVLREDPIAPPYNYGPFDIKLPIV